MKSYPLIAALLATTVLQAQTLDSLDNIIYKIPKNWQADKQAVYTQLTSFSKDRYCQVMIHQKQAANEDKTASFEKEWSDLVLASFDAAATVAPQSKTLKSGQNVLWFGAKAVNSSNNQPVYVELNMFDCGNTVQSAMLISANRQHLQFFDSSWQSLIAEVKTSGAKGVQATAKFPFSGYWGKSSSSAYGISSGAIAANEGYYKSQYDFKPDGNYTFHGESRNEQMQAGEYIVIDESGSYSIIDKQLVIMPNKSKLQQADRSGKVKRTEDLDMSRRTYTWQLHYFKGINETNLVLTPVKDYLHDGGYSVSALFPGSYLLSSSFKPVWKVPLK